MWQEGKQVSAEQMRRIVEALTHRIVGDNVTIRVRSFPGGQIIIEGIRGGDVNPIPPVATKVEVPAVTVLPAIPTTGMEEVYLIGDGQVWRAYVGQGRWTPTQYSTTRTGLPGSS